MGNFKVSQLPSAQKQLRARVENLRRKLPEGRQLPNGDNEATVQAQLDLLRVGVLVFKNGTTELWEPSAGISVKQPASNFGTVKAFSALGGVSHQPLLILPCGLAATS